MAVIRPSSDLRNKYNEISEFCNKYDKPVFITKNGAGDLVVMSNKEYERLSYLHELRNMIDKGIEDMEEGRYRPATDVFNDLAKEFGFDKVQNRNDDGC